MDRTNQQIAEKLNLMAELLEIKGENVFKVRAFSRAADITDRFGNPLASLDE